MFLGVLRVWQKAMFLTRVLFHFLLFNHVIVLVVQAEEVLVDIGLPEAEMAPETEFLGGNVALIVPGSEFFIDPPVGVLGGEVRFLSSFGRDASPTTLYQRWEYGDGQWSNGSSAQHIYARAGTYLVTLFVADALGRPRTYVQLYSVQAESPCRGGLDCLAVDASALSDWDLYMLRLVNRARKDPAGEAARIGSSVVDSKNPVPPLAYHELVGVAATKHTLWMHDNFGQIASGRVPDSFSHFETLDGTSGGQPASATPNYTGAAPGARLTGAGFSWSSYGENIQTNYASFPIPITKSRIEIAHRNWWESSGHRSNMLNSNFSVFGFYVESRSFVPPRGGLTPPFSNIMFSTQSFGRPLSLPRTYVFGVLYDDRDGNGAWTPRGIGDPLREGLGNVNFEVHLRNTEAISAQGKTMSNGAFSLAVGDGTYDVIFYYQGQTIVAEGVVVSGVNTEVGDIEISH